MLGGAVASRIFGVALLASGQSATITGTLAGQIVMEGFVNWKVSPHVRRLITRTMAILPAVITVLVLGDAAVNSMLIFSQVVLSYALPFAIFPLVHISSDPHRMGVHVNSALVKLLAYGIAFLIVSLNMVLLIDQVQNPSNNSL